MQEPVALGMLFGLESAYGCSERCGVDRGAAGVKFSAWR
jgi:hypothetical protein